MKTKKFLALWLLPAGVLTCPAQQHITGHWLMNEGAGTVLANSSPHTTNWSMTLSGNPALWGYWQPGAYAFAAGFGGNVNNFRTDLTAAAAWTSGNTLTLKADVNITALVHNTGLILKGGTVFGAGYFFPGGNSLGWNYGAFCASVDTQYPAAPSIQFRIAGIPPGVWSQPLPTSVTDAVINGGWNTVEWILHNNRVANSVTIRFRLNGTNVGSAVVVPGFYIRDFTDWAGYHGYEATKFYIGAQADDDYNTFTGSISNVSLIAYIGEPTLAAGIANGSLQLTIRGIPEVTYAIESADTLGGTNQWQSLTNLMIPFSPFTWTDPRPAAVGTRFYRAVVIP